MSTPSGSSTDPQLAAKQKAAVLELVIAASFWGFGFIAAIWALRGMGPLSVTGWRFALASVAGLAIMLLAPSLRRAMNWQQFMLAAVPGLLLSLTLVLQTWGLRYTTATKSGFITTLYVLMVPVLERLLLKRRLPRYHFVYVVLALVGVALICDLTGEFFKLGASSAQATSLNFGDVLTLLCAIAASFHILCFGFIYKRIGHAFVFNNFQSMWAGALPLLLALIFEPWPRASFADHSMTGLFMLAFGSTLIAFALQVRAQKVIAPSLASLLFLLESPFATLFAIYFLGENLRSSQWVGAGLILLATLLSTVYGQEVQEETLPG